VDASGRKRPGRRERPAQRISSVRRQAHRELGEAVSEDARSLREDEPVESQEERDFSREAQTRKEREVQGDQKGETEADADPEKIAVAVDGKLLSEIVAESVARGPVASVAERDEGVVRKEREPRSGKGESDRDEVVVALTLAAHGHVRASQDLDV
jgi:hypothetical protein